MGPGKVFALARAVAAQLGITESGGSTTIGSAATVDAVIIGGASTSGVRLEVNSGRLDVREGDDSALAPSGSLTHVLAAATTSGILLKGGSFFDVREGDDSDYAPMTASGVRTRLSSTIYTNMGIAGAALTSGSQFSWAASAADSTGTQDTGLARSAAGIVKVTDGSTGFGVMRVSQPRREFSVHKTPGTAATLTAVGGTPTHTLSGTASNVSDSSGHYVQLSADTATAGIEIASTECTKTENGPIFTAVIKTGAVLPIATERLWVGLASATLASSDSPSGIHAIAFRYAPTTDGTAFWRAVSNDGGADAGTTTTTTAAIATATRYVLLIDATNSASITFYVNGALVATHATNVPTATQALGTQCFVTDVAGGSTKELLISKILFETN